MTEELLNIDYDRSVIGVEQEVGSFTVTEELLVSYAKAVGAKDPMYWDPEAARNGPQRGLVAHPTFISICGWGVGGGPRPEVRINFGKVGQEATLAIENFRPIRPGMVLRVVSKVKEVYAKTGRSGPMVFAVYEEAFYDPQGLKVAAVTRSSVRF